MRAGALRSRLTLHSMAKVADGIGGYQERWVAVRDVWAAVTLPTGRASVVAQQMQSIITAEIFCRPADDLSVGQRLESKSPKAVYQIEVALHDSRDAQVRLLCSSVTHP